ncbi:hypothetical protein QL104_06135 [Pseudomonas piscis]|uniref:Phage tail protein n=1 Tax=Pseudomonas piscis TaxID=2614538 RepID=A0ABY9NKZ3_9PSED|nr:hypothetical protein [Pseudomonas piscis]WMN18985.1 hypothetical protein QL104_06135 [Pseudomonas piscis]
MTLKTIKAGAQPNDGTGDNLRTGAQIINENFAELDQRAAQATAQLSSIETGATRNRPDAELLARANHTGAQPASTISDFSPAVKAILQQYGLAEKIRDIPEGQLNGLSVNTFTFCRPAGAGILPSQVNHYVIHLQLNDAGFAMQIAVNFLSGKSYSRIKDNGNWQAQWVAGIAKGDYGVGAKDDAPFVGVNQNPDTYLTGGYAVGQFTILGTSLTGVLITQAGSNSTAAAQQFVDWASGKMYSRGKSSNAWSPWRALVHAGEFGIGADANAPPGNTMNNFPGSGIYGWAGSYTGAPKSSANGQYIHLNGVNNSTTNRATQLALSHDSDEVWYRRDIQGWQPWKKLVMQGDYGVGATSLQACNDANVIEATGDLLLHPGTLNGPTPGIYGTIRTTFYERSSGNFTQLALASNGVGMFYRGCINGLVQPWMRINEESITNSNGTAVKFSDGTMICWKESSTIQTTSNQVSTGVFLGAAEIFTFPVPFVTIGVVIPSVSYSAYAYCWGSVGEGNNLNQCRIVGFSHAANAQYQAKYFAVGRWR